jgi:hypothetical protein
MRPYEHLRRQPPLLRERDDFQLRPLLRVLSFLPADSIPLNNLTIECVTPAHAVDRLPILVCPLAVSLTQRADQLSVAF